MIADRVVGKGLLPDPLLRTAIAQNCRLRLRRERLRGFDAFEQSVAAMSSGPIAIQTAAANDQHYELPPQFFGVTLGPRTRRQNRTRRRPQPQTLPRPLPLPTTGGNTDDRLTNIEASSVLLNTHPASAPADTHARFAGGTGEANACRTARRWTPVTGRQHPDRKTSRSRFLLICSNNSILDPIPSVASHSSPMSIEPPVANRTEVGPVQASTIRNLALRDARPNGSRSQPSMGASAKLMCSVWRQEQQARSAGQASYGSFS